MCFSGLRRLRAIGTTMTTPADDDEAERVRLLVESVTDYAIYMLDPHGFVTSWNAGAKRFKGYTREEILGQHFSRFYTEEDRKAGLPERALATAAAEGKFEAEAWRVRRDGSRYWAHVVIDPIRNSAGDIIGYAKITRDLTERREAEEALRRSEMQFTLLVQGVTDYAIYMLSPEGIVTSWNSGAERIKGYRPDEILGQHFSRFYTAADQERGEPQRALATAAREGRFENEAIRVRKGGQQFWSHVVLDRLLGPDGELIGFAKITRDITERKEAEARLEETRQALTQSQKLESVGQLAGGIAHDFNNLLMAIQASLELLQKRLPHSDVQSKRLVDNALAAAGRGTSLTQRMLAFGRRQPLDPKAVDLVELVRGMSELLERSLGPTIEIQTVFPLTLPYVWADANQLEMALLNLCVNSRDAMPRGGRITISASAQTAEIGDAIGLPPGPYVCVRVTDNGEGMNQETLKRATEPFFTTKGVGKGTGLGLSMVHGMSEQVGGRLLLQSDEGKGTMVEIWLRAAPATSHGTSKELPAKPHEPSAIPRLKVLAVDDDALVLFNTVAMLEELGHQAFEAHDGAEALSMLEKQNIDVVITDQAMPKMTGLELTKRIAERWPEIPVIIATGYAQLPGTDQKSVLNKPFTESDLARALALRIATPPSA